MSERTQTPPARRGPMGHGPGGPGMTGEKAHNFKGTMGKLIKRLAVYKWSIITVLLFAAASAVFSIVGPKILGKATTKLFEGVMGQVAGTGTGIDFGYIGGILLTLAGLYLISSLFSYIQGWIMSGVSMKLTYQFRKEISQKINRLPLRYFDGTNHGEVLSRVTNDIDTISQTLNQSLTQVITSVTMVVGVLIMMLTISWQMTLLAVAILPITVILSLIVIKHSQKYFKQQQDYLGHVNGHIEEMYGGHVVMKAFNGEEKSVEEFDELNATLYGSAWKSQFASGLMMPIMNFVSNLGYVAVCLLGGWLAIKNTIEVGDIQAFIQYVRNFTQPISQLANVSNIMQQAAAAAERVFEFLEEEEEIPDTPSVKLVKENGELFLESYAVDGPAERKPFEGYVQFQNVRFGYNPDKIIIKDFSASVKPGQKVAIVGPTGAGKTTMVKLLMRFYDVSGGAILIDGHDIRSFSKNDLRDLFGMVLQDTWLYNGSIRENIRYGRLDATDDEVFAAAKAAHADHFIKTLPFGYDMELNEEGTNVSQGQKQLLTIARAILADNKILILDEATSSVDTRTEIRIQKAMDNLMRGRTTFVIAHRLSTIRDADLILVMNEGDIVEQGTHQELLDRNGFYAELYNSQFEASQSA